MHEIEYKINSVLMYKKYLNTTFYFVLLVPRLLLEQVMSSCSTGQEIPAFYVAWRFSTKIKLVSRPSLKTTYGMFPGVKGVGVSSWLLISI
jgi:hypothetical protein